MRKTVHIAFKGDMILSTRVVDRTEFPDLGIHLPPHEPGVGLLHVHIVDGAIELVNLYIDNGGVRVDSGFTVAFDAGGVRRLKNASGEAVQLP